MSDSKSKPAAHAAAVTPSDSVDFYPPTRALYIGTAGALRVNMAGDDLTPGQDVTFGAVAQGVLPISVTRVWSTSTTAANITRLW